MNSRRTLGSGGERKEGLSERGEPSLGESERTKEGETSRVRAFERLFFGSFWRERRALVLLVLVRIAVAVTGLLLWEYASGRWISELFFGRPSVIFGEVALWLRNGDVAWHGWITMQEVGLGLLIGSATAIPIGFLSGRNRYLGSVLDPFIEVGNSLPKAALAPLFILWFGIGMNMKIAVSFSGAFFVIFYYTFQGTRDIPARWLIMARLMGATRPQIYRTIILPSAMSSILRSYRLAIPYAFIGAILGEIIASNRGLGFLVIRAAGFFDTSGVMAALFVIASLNFFLIRVLGFVERRVLKWKPDSDETVMAAL